jgi:hypothetical protein
MARRRGDDPVESLCRAWGRTRRKLLGLEDPLEAREYIGAPRSTLGARRDLHAGARSPGKIEQHFPEVYPDEDQRLVNSAFHAMPERLKMVMDIHYCAHSDVDTKADFFCISVQTYWQRVRDVRAFVEGWVTAKATDHLNIYKQPSKMA